MILSNGACSGQPWNPSPILRVHVSVVQRFQCSARRTCQRFDDLDRVDILHQAAEHGGLVAAAGADFQDAVGRLRVERFGHERDNERRRDRLLIADRQSHILIGQLARLTRHEFVSRRVAHRFNHALVLDSGIDHGRLHHPLAGRFELRGEVETGANRTGRKHARHASNQQTLRVCCPDSVVVGACIVTAEVSRLGAHSLCQRHERRFQVHFLFAEELELVAFRDQQVGKSL